MFPPRQSAVFSSDSGLSGITRVVLTQASVQQATPMQNAAFILRQGLLYLMCDHWKAAAIHSWNRKHASKSTSARNFVESGFNSPTLLCATYFSSVRKITNLAQCFKRIVLWIHKSGPVPLLVQSACQVSNGFFNFATISTSGELS